MKQKNNFIDIGFWSPLEIPKIPNRPCPKFASDSIGNDPANHKTRWNDIHTETLRFEEITYSSSHPYANAQDVTQLIAFPGAQNISITFSTLTDLEHNHDYVQFLEKRNDPSIYYKKQKQFDAFIKKLFERPGSEAHQIELEIQSEERRQRSKIEVARNFSLD